MGIRGELFPTDIWICTNYIIITCLTGEGYIATLRQGLFTNLYAKAMTNSLEIYATLTFHVQTCIFTYVYL